MLKLNSLAPRVALGKAFAPSITIKSLSCRLRPDAGKFAARFMFSYSPRFANLNSLTRIQCPRGLSPSITVLLYALARASK
jgi:hypothetical protein